MNQNQTLVIPADQPGAIALAAQALLRGELIALPTDTVYGIAAHALLPQAVESLFAAKDRPLTIPIPLLLPEPQAMADVCVDIPAVAWRLAERFWPGALSLVLDRAPAVPSIVTSGGPTVAVRVPDHPTVRELCRLLGAPLATTSANRHGHPAPTTADQVLAGLAGRISILLDGGPCIGGTASTVLDLTSTTPTLLRHGPVTAQQLADLIPLDTD